MTMCWKTLVLLFVLFAAHLGNSKVTKGKEVEPEKTGIQNRNSQLSEKETTVKKKTILRRIKDRAKWLKSKLKKAKWWHWFIAMEIVILSIAPVILFFPLAAIPLGVIGGVGGMAITMKRSGNMD